MPMKSKIRNGILNQIGYGKAYIFAQRTYHKINNVFMDIKRCKNKINKVIQTMLSYKCYMNNTTKEEIGALARRVSRPIVDEDGPLVSIIINAVDTNLNHIKSVLTLIKTNTLYKNYEVILIGNKYDYRLKKYLRKSGNDAVKYVHVDRDKLYNEMLDSAVSCANGKYFAIINNTLPLYGWLSELMITFTRTTDVGVVGARLIYLNRPYANDYIQFKLFKDEIIPYNSTLNYGNPLYDDYDNDYEIEVPIINNSCIFTSKDILNRLLEYKDYCILNSIDICVKIREMNKKIITNKKAILLQNRKHIPNFNSIQERDLIKSVWTEKLENKEKFWSEIPLHIGFLVTEFSPYTTAGDLFSAYGLGQGLIERYGYQVSYFPRKPIFEWDKIPDSIDILIAMRPDHDIRKSEIFPRTIKIAWIRGSIDEWLDKPWVHHFDGIITSSQIVLQEAIKIAGKDKLWGVVPLAVPYDLLHNNTSLDRDIDVSFVGNIYEVPRDIVNNLDLSQGFDFHFYGKLEGGLTHSWKPYHKGIVYHKDLYKIYNRSKIVIEDTAPFNRGTVNLRVFEAAACGALIIANETPGIEELFGNDVLIYKDKEDLTAKIRYYLNNEEERKKEAEKIKKIILEKHTFSHRAQQFKKLIAERILYK